MGLPSDRFCLAKTDGTKTEQNIDANPDCKEEQKARLLERFCYRNQRNASGVLANIAHSANFAGAKEEAHCACHLARNCSGSTQNRIVSVPVTDEMCGETAYSAKGGKQQKPPRANSFGYGAAKSEHPDRINCQMKPVAVDEHVGNDAGEIADIATRDVDIRFAVAGRNKG